jgi:hypothetical protein
MALTKDDPRWTKQLVHRLLFLKTQPLEPNDIAATICKEFAVKWITADQVIRKLQELYFLDTLGYWE